MQTHLSPQACESNRIALYTGTAQAQYFVSRQCVYIQLRQIEVHT